MLETLLAVAGVVAGTTGELRPEPCGFEVPMEIAPRVTCYRLAVPRDYADVSAGTFDLAVLIRRAQNPRPALDPVLMIHGGPGGNGLARRTTALSADPLPGADLVLFDQRGAGASEPRPCGGALAGLRQTLADDRPWAESVAMASAKWKSCAARRDAAGIRPEHFGTSVTTEDVEYLRRAVGARRWNIFTGSYGTAVALDVMAARPATVRAAAMFGMTIPEGSNGDVESALDVAVARSARLCREDPTCANLHRDLAADFRHAVRQLDREPMRVVVTGLGLRDDLFVMNGREFELFVDSRMLSTERAATFPALVRAALSRDTSAFTTVIREETRRLDEQDAFGRLSVHCRDKSRYHRRRPTDRGYIFGQLPDVCPHWSSLGPVRRVPVNTSTPVLILQGELDTTTPSTNAIETARQLGRKATVLMFPRAGHAIGVEPGCEQDLVAQFLAKPDGKVSPACGAYRYGTDDQ